MESISKQDISYLIAVNASEQSRLNEIVIEFEKWECKQEDCLKILQDLICDGTIELTRPVGDSFEDLGKEKSLSKVKTWNMLKTCEFIMFLTEKGEKRWESDDWGITEKRARHLLFSPKV